MISVGVDAGSRAIKIVLFDSAKKEIIAKDVTDQGVEQARLARSLLDKLLEENSIDRADVGKAIATGYGRNAVDFTDTAVTEITCHARGVRYVAPEARTVIDIGGEDSKLILLDTSGKVRDFAMNDRCAAGTGRFLEVVAERLGASLETLGDMAAASQRPAAISSMCVVFAETEIIGLLAAGTPRENIVAGVQTAIAGRVVGMTGRRVDEPIVFTGGGALVSGMKEALERALKRTVVTAPNPQMTGALGAALLAADGM